MIDCISEKGDLFYCLCKALYIDSRLLIGIDLIQKFYVLVVLKVYASLIKERSIYMQVGFSKVAYTF